MQGEPRVRGVASAVAVCLGLSLLGCSAAPNTAAPTQSPADSEGPAATAAAFAEALNDRDTATLMKLSGLTPESFACDTLAGQFEVWAGALDYRVDDEPTADHPVAELSYPSWSTAQETPEMSDEERTSIDLNMVDSGGEWSVDWPAQWQISVLPPDGQAYMRIGYDDDACVLAADGGKFETLAFPGPQTLFFAEDEQMTGMVSESIVVGQ